MAAVGTNTTHRVRARLEHRGAQRLRVRVAQEDRSPEHMERLRSQLSIHPAVQKVEVNHRTGSILVRGEVPSELEDAMRKSLELVEEAGPENVPEAGVESVVLLVKSLDGRIRRSTGSRVSLRWLVPASFVAVAVRQLMREGLTVGAIPWYVLLYYGVDSFLKLYPHHAPKAHDQKAV